MTGRACGKVILFGEHAAVYHKPAIAVPVGLYTTAEIRPGSGEIHTDIYDGPIGIRSDQALAQAARLALERIGSADDNIDIMIKSELPPAAGLGSGAAVCIAIMRAVAAYNNKTLSPQELAELSYKTEQIFHGNPSGIDNTVISYEQPVWFVRGKRIEPLEIHRPFTILIADTGVKGSTKEMVAGVAERRATAQARYDSMFDEIAGISTRARRIIECGDPAQLGPLMDRNHALLREMGVSHPALETLVSAAKDAGALGAKLVGSGGGGNAIALVRDEDAATVAGALTTAGARRVFTTTVKQG